MFKLRDKSWDLSLKKISRYNQFAELYYDVLKNYKDDVERKRHIQTSIYRAVYECAVEIKKRPSTLVSVEGYLFF